MKKWHIGFIAVLLLAACSTPPRDSGEVHDLRRRAETQLGNGSREADRGSFENALIFLNEAWRLAVVADDPELRIRVGLSRGNASFSFGHSDQAAEDWNNALNEALRIGNQELAAVCRIHISRGRLLSAEGATAAQAVRDELSRDIALIRNNLYSAFAWTVIAFAERELGRYDLAETASRRSLEIHERGRRFELAAYDWFLIASFRSRSSNYSGALQALETAIAFDRRVENSWGLANDWRAMGDVHSRAGNSEAARAAYTRAAEIFHALGMGEAATQALSRMD